MERKLGQRVAAEELSGFEAVVVATGVNPRPADFEGHNRPEVLSYIEVLQGAKVGSRVAIVGTGGIGFDVAQFLSCEGPACQPEQDRFLEEWGIDTEIAQAGGLLPTGPKLPKSARHITMMQRSEGKVGSRLGKTTGWIHRTVLRAKGVEMLSGVKYVKKDDAGFHIEDAEGQPRCLEVDHVVICAGQESERSLFDTLTTAGKEVHLIGGAKKAGELDAKRAIRQGTELGTRL